MIIALVLGTVLLWLVLDSTGATNPIRDALTGIVSPLQLVFGRVFDPVTDQLEALRQGAELVRQNRDLRQQLAEAQSRLALLEEAQHENQDLRRQLEFKSIVPNYQLIAAEVLGRDPSQYLHYLVIDRGSNDGVRVGMPVITEAGLVGRISRVSSGSSQVMLLTDSQSAVNAYVQRSRATGVVQGTLGPDLSLEYVLRGETIVVGDVLLTSGVGGNFPRRLVIGQVAEVRQNDIEAHTSAVVVPAANLAELESVLILMNFEPDELLDEP